MHYVWAVLLFIVSLFFLLAVIGVWTDKKDQKGRLSGSLIMLVICGVCGYFGFALWPSHSSVSAKSKSQSTSNKSPTQAEYMDYKNNQWIYDQKVNDVAQSMIKMYQDYKVGNISADKLRRSAPTDYGIMQNFKSIFNHTVPEDYRAFDTKISTITTSEINSVLDLESSYGSTIDSTVSQLQQFTDEFANVAKSFPQPAKTVSSNVTAGPEHISVNLGLGDTVSWVESHLGSPSTVQRAMSNGYGMYTYDNDNIQVTYENGRVEYYEKDYPSDVSLAQAEQDGKGLIPKDAVFTGRKYTYNHGGAQETIYVYKSQSLIKLWSADTFKNVDGVNQPGVFDLVYEYDTLNHPDKVMAVIAFASDNP
jgi:hypothetical protein